MVYQWKQGREHTVPASIVGERIETIREAKGGTLAPMDLVDDARPKTSPLHPLFEWDNKVASELYREHQARGVIIAIVSIEEETPEAAEERARPKQVYVGVGTRRTGPEFTTVEVAMADDTLRDRVLADTRRQLNGLARRLEQFEEAAELIDTLGRAVSIIDELGVKQASA